MSYRTTPIVLPRYSQFLDVREPSWRRSACGIVALQMVLDAYREPPARSAPARIGALIRAGTKMGAYDSRHGWRHAGLVRLARSRGFRARRFDWAHFTPARSVRLLQQEVSAGPVVASVHRNLVPGESGHLVVVLRVNARTVLYYDPDVRTRKQIARRVSLNRFRKGWKRRGIVVRPRVAILLRSGK